MKPDETEVSGTFAARLEKWGVPVTRTSSGYFVPAWAVLPNSAATIRAAATDPALQARLIAQDRERQAKISRFRKGGRL